MEIINRTIVQIAENKRYHFPCFAIILILLLAISYYCFPIFPGHDYPFHIRRMDVLIDVLKNGDFPFYMDYSGLNGYGYYLNVFNTDIILVPFALIGIYTGPFVAYEITIYTMAFLCGVFTYKAVSKVFNNSFIAFVSAILYTFSYYKLIDTYTRSALSETLCFTFVPLVMWGMYEIISGNYKKWYILSIGMSLMVFAHTASPYITSFTILIIILMTIRRFIKEPKRIYAFILAVVATIFISACFIFPLLEIMQSTTFAMDKVVKEEGIFGMASPSSFYFLIKGMFTGIMPSIIPNLIMGSGIVITWIISLRLFISGKEQLLKRADFLLIIGVILILVMSPLYPWHTFPFSELGIIQFPWRFHLLISFFWAVAGSIYLFILLKTNIRRIKIGLTAVLVFTTIMIVSSSRDYYHVFNKISIENIKPEPGNDYITYGGTSLSARVPTPVGQFVYERGDSVGYNNDNTHITDFARIRNVITFDVKVEKADSLELPLSYYIGYKATLNNKIIPTKESGQGLIQIPADESGNVEIYFVGTTVQKISWIISAISIIGLCVYILIPKRKRKSKTNEDN